MKFESLISEDGCASLGRISFWILFFLAIGKFWILGDDTPAGLTQSLMALLAYGLGKRYVDSKEGGK
jgi:hypothetical protein